MLVRENYYYHRGGASLTEVLWLSRLFVSVNRIFSDRTAESLDDLPRNESVATDDAYDTSDEFICYGDNDQQKAELSAAEAEVFVVIPLDRHPSGMFR